MKRKNMLKVHEQDHNAQIAEKLRQFPLLGYEQDGWKVKFAKEFDMTNDRVMFQDTPGKGRLPLYEGRMIWQFNHRLVEPRYWVDEKAGRKALLGNQTDTGQDLDYQCFRFGFRNTRRRLMNAPS